MRSTMRILSLLVFVSSLTWLTSGFGADTLRVYQLKEIVVEATRIQVPYKHLPLSIDIVTHDEIDHSTANSATDAVSFLPGVFVQRTGDFGRADVAIRGLGNMGKRLSVLIDGHPVKMGLFGCTITHALPLNNVERIEVIRAPTSVLYGSDALGGVINIVTSEPPENPTATGEISYGSYTTLKYRLSHGTTIGDLGYLISFDRRTSDGHLPNSAYEGTDISTKLTFDRSATKISVLFKYFDGHKEEPALSTDPPGTQSDIWNDYKRGTIDAVLTHQIGNGKLTFKAYDEFGEHEFSDGWHSKDHSRGAMLHYSGSLNHSIDFNLGIDFREQSGERLSQPKGDWSKNEVGVFAFSEAQIIPSVNATFGLRVNSDKISGVTLSPHAGLTIGLDESTTLKLSASRGFRSPQLSELYLFPSSNTDLKPEIVWNYEIGIERRISGLLRARLVGFMLKGENFIQLVRCDSPPPLYRFANVGEIDFRGIEATAVLAPSSMINCSVSFTYLDPGERTKGRPKQKLNASIVARLLDTDLSWSSEYVADYYAEDNYREKIENYLVNNVRISRHIFDTLEAFLTVKNIFDEHYDIYVEIPGGKSGTYRMPGRRYLVGISYRWEKAK